jgi:hypothetical protein
VQRCDVTSYLAEDRRCGTELCCHGCSYVTGTERTDYCAWDGHFPLGNEKILARARARQGVGKSNFFFRIEEKNRTGISFSSKNLHFAQTSILVSFHAKIKEPRTIKKILFPKE